MPGWGFPTGSKKAHYFTDDGRSLCERWGFFRGELEDDKHDHPGNCAICCRRYFERQKAVPAPAADTGGWAS